MFKKTTALHKLREERENMKKNPPPCCSAGPIDTKNLYEWSAVIDGPEDTPYAGGTFNLMITFPSTYPKDPPEVKFTTKIYHPNVDQNGVICMDILSSEWRDFKGSYQVPRLLLSIIALLSDPNFESAYAYANDPTKYSEAAREWTYAYAM